MVRFFYCVYQVFIAIPLLVLLTFLTAIVTMIGCYMGGGRFWGFYPSVAWSWLFCKILLLPVEVEGRENIEKSTPYVFVANHQGAFDIWLLFGFLHHEFRWMMKISLMKIPFVGKACKAAKHVMVDQSSRAGVKRTMEDARSILSKGISVSVFPEGTRSRTGKMGPFRKGAFLLAHSFHLPIVPITINGSFDILPRTHDISFVHRRKLKLTIHKPIDTKGMSLDEMSQISYDVIHSSLDEKYK